MKTQVFAFALPLGRLSEGFLPPILSAEGRFWLQTLTEDREVPDLIEVSLDSERLGPILHLGALRESIPVSATDVRNPLHKEERTRIDAFFTGSTVIFGDRQSVKLHLRHQLPQFVFSLRQRPYTFADLLTYLDEDSLASAVRAAKSVEIGSVVARYGTKATETIINNADDAQPYQPSKVIDMIRWRQHTRELAATPTYYSAPRLPSPRSKTSDRAHGTPRHA